jgi:hypothetical protein
MSKAWFTIAFILALGGCSPDSSDPNLAAVPGLNAQQKKSLSAWLKQHPTFRPASDNDCNCADDLKEMRQQGAWGHPLPDFQPYLKIGDFNHDGANDFAIIAIQKNDPSKRSFLVFNGPFSGRTKPPVLNQDISPRTAIFYDPPEHPLVIGAFESEGCVILPRGLGYVLDCDYGG